MQVSLRTGSARKFRDACISNCNVSVVVTRETVKVGIPVGRGLLSTRAISARPLILRCFFYERPTSVFRRCRANSTPAITVLYMHPQRFSFFFFGRFDISRAHALLKQLQRAYEKQDTAFARRPVVSVWHFHVGNLVLYVAVN